MKGRTKFQRFARLFITESVNIVPPVSMWAVVTREMPHLVRTGDGCDIQPLLRILLHASSRYVFHSEILDPRKTRQWMPDVLMLRGSGEMPPEEIVSLLREMYGWPAPGPCVPGSPVRRARR